MTSRACARRRASRARAWRHVSRSSSTPRVRGVAAPRREAHLGRRGGRLCGERLAERGLRGLERAPNARRLVAPEPRDERHDVHAAQRRAVRNVVAARVRHAEPNLARFRRCEQRAEVVVELGARVRRSRAARAVIFRRRRRNDSDARWLEPGQPRLELVSRRCELRAGRRPRLAGHERGCLCEYGRCPAVEVEAVLCPVVKQQRDEHDLGIRALHVRLRADGGRL